MKTAAEVLVLNVSNEKVEVKVVGQMSTDLLAKKKLVSKTNNKPVDTKFVKRVILLEDIKTRRIDEETWEALARLIPEFPKQYNRILADVYKIIQYLRVTKHKYIQDTLEPTADGENIYQFEIFKIMKTGDCVTSKYQSADRDANSEKPYFKTPEEALNAGIKACVSLMEKEWTLKERK